jgi:pimeloyl-ACP methyl ester carboxylesterase
MPSVISKDGTEISYLVQGTGPVIVLVDGALCYTEAGPTPELLPTLSQHFTVYAYDRRGRGKSSDTKPYAVEREIEDLVAILDVAGKDAYVCGISSGGALALYAVAAGLLPKKLLLFETPFTAVDENDRKLPDDPVGDLENMLAQNRRGDMVSYFMTQLIGVPGFFMIVTKTIMRKNWNITRSLAHTLPYDIRIMDETKFGIPLEAARQINVPCTVMYGSKTADILQKSAKALAQAIPNAQLVVVEGQSHMIKAKTMVPALLAQCK